MGKRNNKKNSIKNKGTTGNDLKTESVANHCISTIELKNVIVSALREYEQEKNTTEPIETEKVNCGNKGFWDKLLIVLGMPFAKRKSIKGSETVKLMTSAFLATLFNWLRIVGLFITGIAVITIGVLFVTEPKDLTFVFKVCFLVLIVFISYLFAGLFRRVSVEVENMTDESLLIAFFAAIGTWTSIIIAAVALLK